MINKKNINMNNERRVVITGVGVVSPVGNNVESFWNNLVNGVSGIGEAKSYDTSDLQVKIAAEVKDFDPTLYGITKAAARKSDIYSLYAQAAANQAMQDSGLEINPERLGVYVGSGIGGIHTFVTETEKMVKDGPQWISPQFIPMMISNIAAGSVAIAHNAQGPCLPIVTACATGTHAIGEAFIAIKAGRADAIIAGGTEAATHRLSVAGFANMKALTKAENPNYASLPFSADRQGFVIGEGAGIMILEEYEHAKARGAKIYAEVAGYGNTCDAHHITAPRPDGSTPSKAIKLALQEANYQPSETLHINAHGTGTPLNDIAETNAIKIALGEEDAKKAIICSTKSMTGHLLGAAGGVELIAAALAIHTGDVPPTINLTNPDPACDLNYTPNVSVKADIDVAISTSLGFGGHNACVAIRKVK